MLSSKPEGTNTLKLGIIAEGHAEVTINTNSGASKWDLCAPQIILEEAGGMVTDLNGNPVDYLSNTTTLENSFIATNGALHNEILLALQNHHAA